MQELDFSNADPADLAEYNDLTEQILSTNDPEERHYLLKLRAEVMSRILGANINSVNR